MPTDKDADPSQKQPAQPSDRPEVRHKHPIQPLRGLLARLFHHGNTPWTVRTGRPRNRAPQTTAEILRAKRSDDR
jgi:hypothetical protein